MAAKTRSWEMDWAGPHGTAWGTVNACLTTITSAIVAHETERHWPLSTLLTMTSAVGAIVLGIVYTLLRGALGKPQQGVTVVYKLLCWIGAGVWLVVTLSRYSWTAKSFLAHVAALVVLAVIAGLAAGLASDPKPQPSAPATAPAPLVPADPAQAELDSEARTWEARLAAKCGGTGWSVPNIEHWPRGNGYFVEGHAPHGMSWKAVDRALEDLGADLDLPYGGAIRVTMGRTRRVAIVSVTTKDLLADDTIYPADRAVHSIRDDLEIGFRDDGSPIGPNLLQQCMLLSGEARSGKTNAGHCLTAELTTTDDALEWKYELTGGGFWASWMYDWLDGAYPTPPIDWCAFDGQELLWMTRAALRVGYARKPGYQHLMRQADDDKLPVSPQVPAIIVTGDEIAKITGNMSEHPQARENLRLIVFELGAVAVRTVFLALRGTDDVISQAIQSQCHVRGVMKVNSKAEAGWTLGTGHDFGPQDTPYPGSGGLVLGSGMPVERVKWHRMLPSLIAAIARLGSTRRPAIDEPSRRAANGRHPDGTPMGDLLPGELDCYDTRWARFRAWSAKSGPAGTARTAAPVPVGPGSVATLTTEAALAGMDEALAAVDRRVAELRATRVDDPEETRAEFARLMTEAGFGDDWVVDANHEETAPKPTDRQMMLDLIFDAGQEGIEPKDLLGLMAQAGVIVSRSTLHNYLNEALTAGAVHKPRHGRWALRPQT